MPKLNVLVAGSTGYIGIQLIKLLVKHKYVRIKYLCGNSSVGKNVSSYDNSRSIKNLPKIIKFDKKYLNELESGTIEDQPAPEIAIKYWNLPLHSTLKDVVKVIRDDEAGHRDVNHSFADLINLRKTKKSINSTNKKNQNKKADLEKISN